MPREFGAWSRSSTDALYAPQSPNLVAPVDPRQITSVTTIAAASNIYAARVVIPKTGILHDFSVFIGTPSGNIQGCIYDTSATTRNLLWSSGSVAVAGTNAWFTIADPALSVKAGDQLDFGLIVDNTTVTIGRSVVLGNGSVSVLPANFWPSSLGGAPKLTWNNAPGSFTTPATLAESALAANANWWFSMARVA